MAEAVFVQDPKSWTHEFKSWDGVVGRFLGRRVTNGAGIAKEEAPHPGGPPHGRTGINYSTGELSGGIIPDLGRWGPGLDLEGRIVAIPEHALYVHQGTQPHVIVPKVPGGRLVFFWHKKGRVVSFPHVNHPGTRADPFLERALSAIMRTF